MTVLALAERVLEASVPVFLAGSQKNSGKTTVLNALLEQLRCMGACASFLTTGHDGERKDAFFGNEKPAVRVAPGERFCTTARGLMGVDASFLRFVGVTTAGEVEQLALWRAREEGEVELHGPRDAAGVWDIIRMLGPGEGPLLVDGALDRWTAMKDGASAVILVLSGGTLSSPGKAARWVADRVALLHLPLDLEYDVVLPAGEFSAQTVRGTRVWLQGAVTQERLQEVLFAEPARVILTSPMHLFVSAALFARSHDLLAVRSAPRLLGVAVNFFNVRDGSPQRWAEAVREALPECLVVDPLAL